MFSGHARGASWSCVSFRHQPQNKRVGFFSLNDSTGTCLAWVGWGREVVVMRAGGGGGGGGGVGGGGGGLMFWEGAVGGYAKY